METLNWVTSKWVWSPLFLAFCRSGGSAAFFGNGNWQDS